MKPSDGDPSRKHKPIRRIVIATLGALTLLAACTLRPRGEWYVATTGDDSNSCQTAADACRTIAGAIGKASAGHTIHVAAGTYVESGLVITMNLLIQGEGAGVTIVDADGLGPMFEVNSTGISRLSLADMTLQNAQVAIFVAEGAAVTLADVIVAHNEGPPNEGAIHNRGDLEIFGGAITSNTVPAGPAWTPDDPLAAIVNVGSLEIRDSFLEKNHGHGIYNQPGATILMQNVQVRDNGFFGVYNDGGIFRVDHSTFERNGIRADGGGGGILTSRRSAELTMTNTTVREGHFGMQSINGSPAMISQSLFVAQELDPLFGITGLIVSDRGAGVHLTNVTFSGFDEAVVANFDGSILLHNVTIADSDFGIVVEEGGRVEMENTLVAENLRQACEIEASGGTIVSYGYSMADDTSCPFRSAGDRTGISIPLLPLAANGGPTLTHALDLAGANPALDGGNPAGCRAPDGTVLTVDQRGELRPYGPACDVGAFEAGAELFISGGAGPAPITVTPTITATPTATPSPPTIRRDTLCWLGPGPIYPVVSSIQQGTVVELLGVGALEGWFVINNPRFNLPCWVDADDLDVDPNLDLTVLIIFPVPPTPTPTPTPTFTPTATPTNTPCPNCP